MLNQEITHDVNQISTQSPRRRRRNWPSTRILLLDRLAETTEDRGAWDEFVDLYMPIVYQFCRCRGLQDADAEEVTQIVFTNVVRALPSFHYDTNRGRFRSWLCTIVCREIIRHRQKASTYPVSVSETERSDLLIATRQEMEAVWSELYYANVLDVAMRSVQVRVTGIEWQAFQMHWEQHMPAPEIASALEKTINWVYKAKFRVQKMLEQVVAELAEDEPILHR